MDNTSSRRDELRAKYSRYRHWEIFKILETDLAKVSRYISISGDNFKTHSAEVSKKRLKHIKKTKSSETAGYSLF